MSRSMNALFRSSAFLCAATLILAACSENTTTPDTRIAPAVEPSANAYPEFNGPSADAHIMHTKPWFAQNPSQNAPGGGHGKPGGGGSTSNGISYHGGSVLQSGTKVSAVYWAASTIYNGGPAAGTTGAGSSDGSLVGDFLNHLGTSSYFNINTSYTDGSGTPIQNSVSYTQFWANNSYNVPADGQTVSDSQMLSMLQYAFNNGKLTYDPGTLYIIFTAGKVNLGGGFGTQYCAYHTHGTVSVDGASKVVLYSAMPYTYAYQGACTNGTASPNNDPAADAEVNVVAHETEETTTDMLGNAWFDTRGYENADKCAWTWGSLLTAPNGGVYNIVVGGKNYLVQQNWVNASGGYCAKSY
jgi:hypothetical protein